jgi:hypothetical protein
MHNILTHDLKRHHLEISRELEEQRRIISEATAYAKKLDTALSAVNLALGTIGKETALKFAPYWDKDVA